MFRLILMVLLASYVLTQDEDLYSLYGETGQNRVIICTQETVDCEGALWKPRWVLTRSSCLYDLPFWALAVFKFKKGCDDYYMGLAGDTARRIYASFPFPDPDLDICLLYLESALESVEKLVNETLAREHFKEYEPWLQKTVHTYLYGNSHAKWAAEVASPMRMFLIAGVMPSAALIIFFLFILFYTSPNKNRSFSSDNNLSV